MGEIVEVRGLLWGAETVAFLENGVQECAIVGGY